MGVRGGRSRSYFQVRSSHLGILERNKKKDEVKRSQRLQRALKIPPSPNPRSAYYTHLHLQLSGEIDHVQFPTNQPPTASFECINNPPPLHLSSPAFLHTAFISLTHSARSHAFPSMDPPSARPPRKNFWIWMRNPKMSFPPQPCQV